MSQLAQIFNENFSEEAETSQAKVAAATEVLGQNPYEMTDEEVDAKIAELQENEKFAAEAGLEFARGEIMAEGFMHRLAEEGTIPELNEKLSFIVEKLGGQTNGATQS